MTTAQQLDARPTVKRMTTAQQFTTRPTSRHITSSTAAYAKVVVQEYFTFSIHQPYAPQAIAASSAYHMNGRGAPITTYEGKGRRRARSSADTIWDQDTARLAGLNRNSSLAQHYCYAQQQHTTSKHCSLYEGIGSREFLHFNTPSLRTTSNRSELSISYEWQTSTTCHI